ncbi:MAG: RtcB family protein [Phycisphaerales bacterium]|nr:RtcB family protein [Phycisphaerales bacterium]
MKASELLRLGFPDGPVIAMARAAAGTARMAGKSRHEVKSLLGSILADPQAFVNDPLFGKVATSLAQSGAARPAKRKHREYELGTLDYGRAEPLDYAVWGEDIDPQAHQQMRNACALPISVKGALMPDAHVGYGLPIGGVLATNNAVIPYAVGVDIACRMMMTVFDLPPERLNEQSDRFRRILEEQTRFGVGSEWKPRRQHPVMDEDWRITPVTARLKDLAWSQLGTSGSGNHFAEFGEFMLDKPLGHLPPGRYLALLSHSGSRGTGNKIATHYSKWAMSKHRKMPSSLRHLAWLDLDEDGREYWAAMELMGRYASANHHIIHRQVVAAVGEPPALQVENHHNFAWKEQHDGREVIVHRKGATPAARGVLGIIPGSMATPAFLVEGLGDPRSLSSASHGAGRRMSRGEASRTFRWPQVKAFLAERGVRLLSAGLDEAPWAYKDIEAVMAAQHDLVHPLAQFMPRLVRMSRSGEPPED